MDQTSHRFENNRVDEILSLFCVVLNTLPRYTIHAYVSAHSLCFCDYVLSGFKTIVISYANAYFFASTQAIICTGTMSVYCLKRKESFQKFHPVIIAESLFVMLLPSQTKKHVISVEVFAF